MHVFLRLYQLSFTPIFFVPLLFPTYNSSFFFLSFDSDVLYVVVGCLYVFEVCVIMYARASVYLSLRVMCVGW